ncbi:hypothetical protein PSTT_14076, partial [Puccinia striiformis]
ASKLTSQVSVDLVISKFDSLGSKWRSENKDKDKEVHQISLMKDSVLRLHSSILPQLRDQIRTLSEALDPEDLMKDPHSKLAFITEDVGSVCPCYSFRLFNTMKPRSEQTNDYHLRECKSYRLHSTNHDLSMQLQWQFREFCRSAGTLINRLNLSTKPNDGVPHVSLVRESLLQRTSSALNSIDLAIHWFIRPELDLVQTSWGPAAAN